MSVPLHLVCAALAILTTVAIRAETFPSGLNGNATIADEANILRAGDAVSIRSTANDLFSDTGFPLAVVTIPSLAIHGGVDMQSYAEALFKEWARDSGTRNRGILLLVSPGDHKVWIELGRFWGSYEDDACHAIEQEVFIPMVRRRSYSSAMQRTAIALAAMARRDKTVDVRVFWFYIALKLIGVALVLSWPIRRLVLSSRRST